MPTGDAAYFSQLHGCGTIDHDKFSFVDPCQSRQHFFERRGVAARATLRANRIGGAVHPVTAVALLKSQRKVVRREDSADSALLKLRNDFVQLHEPRRQ